MSLISVHFFMLCARLAGLKTKKSGANVSFNCATGAFMLSVLFKRRTKLAFAAHYLIGFTNLAKCVSVCVCII